MNINKKQILSALAATLFATSAFATVINDDYIGADDHGYGDRIGGAIFEIHNMDVTLTGSILNVKISTNYAGEPIGHPSGAPTYGTGYGDLFLSSAWTPDGTLANGYITDDNTNGTLWTYGVSIDDDRFDGSLAGGTTSLFKLNGATNDANAVLSDDLTNNTFRNGQEVVVDTATSDTVDTGTNGTWNMVAGDFINFSIDLTGTGLLNGSEIALHWGMTCGNDTIEGAFDVPEPTLLLLLSSGLIGLFAVGRRKA